MKQITYLIGAGASAKALPIVKEMAKRMEETLAKIMDPIFQLSNEPFINSNFGSTTKYAVQKELIEDFKWLLNNVQKHASIDTFAKKLYLKGERADLIKLKATFSAYITFEQILKPSDIRYDAFLASILNIDNRTFPENIKIISWNYDYQFEKAYSEYSGNIEIGVNQHFLNINSKNLRPKNNKKFTIYKLNGTAGFMGRLPSSTTHFHRRFTDNFDPDVLTEIIKSYYIVKTHPEMFSALSFAWEEAFESERDIVANTIEGIVETDVLVIIGYSFPFFNRGIDRKLLNSMKKLYKVYFQSPEATRLIDRFKATRDDIFPENLIQVLDVEQFYLPDEL